MLENTCQLTWNLTWILLSNPQPSWETVCVKYFPLIFYQIYLIRLCFSWLKPPLLGRIILYILNYGICFILLKHHALKRKCHFDKIFITGCTESCQNDNFQCSQWWKFRQMTLYIWMRINVTVWLKFDRNINKCIMSCNHVPYFHYLSLSNADFVPLGEGTYHF